MPNDTNRNHRHNVPISGFNNSDSTTNKTNEVVEIDLVDVFYALLDQLKWILLAAILCAGIMFVKDTYFTKPQYKTTSKLYVLNSKDSAISLSDLQIGSQLTSDYMEVFKNWPVHEKVLSILGWDMSYTDIAKHISVSNPSGTRILYITATIDSPEKAKILADTYANVARSFIATKMDTQEPSLFSEALLPTVPSSPEKAKDLILGFLIGAVLASAVVIFLHLTNDNLRTADDINNKLKLPLLGMVPMQDFDKQEDKKSQHKDGKQKSRKGETSEHQHHTHAAKLETNPVTGDVSPSRAVPETLNSSEYRVAVLNNLRQLDYHGEEAFNTICTNLSFTGANTKKIVITSNYMSEGKSFISIQLANNLARRGRKVVLVDSDIRRSFMMRDTGFSTNGKPYGLAHYLAGQCKLQDILYTTNPYGACLIPSGTTVADPINLLDTELFSKLLDELATEFDYVIVDAPPIGMVIDAAVIAKTCDGVVFVTEYNKTSHREMLSSKAQMEQSQARILGCIMNKVTFDGIASKRYYYKGYYKHYSNEYYTKGDND